MPYHGAYLELLADDVVEEVLLLQVGPFRERELSHAAVRPELILRLPVHGFQPAQVN